MVVNTVEVRKGLTAACGKFESVRIEALVQIQLDEKDDAKSAYIRGWDMVDDQLNNQIEELQDVLQETSIFKMSSSEKKESKSRKSRKSRVKS
jgi:hypothetical protein